MLSKLELCTCDAFLLKPSQTQRLFILLDGSRVIGRRGLMIWMLSKRQSICWPIIMTIQLNIHVNE